MQDYDASPTEEISAVSRRQGLLARWGKPAAVTALAISLVLHVVVLLIAAMIVFSSSAGSKGDLADPVQFAVMTAEDLAQLQDAALDLAAPSVEELPVPDSPEIDLEVSEIEAELTGDTAELEAQLGGGDIDDGSVGVSGAGSGSANFFGLEASGSRFAYVVDVSGSMDTNGKIDRLRIELVKSIDGMLESAEFFVSLYNSSASSLGGKADWVDATDSGKRWANRHLANIQAVGGTNPLPGFELVFSRRPRPDAIYFMTDGEFDPGVADELYRMNAEYRIPIHCITFGSRGAEAAMKKIAKDSGGTYTHVAGPGG
jgi:von Willebrand factor type A domain